MRKVAIVTGGSSGIGKAIAARISRDNYTVYNFSHQASQNSTFVHSEQCDITDFAKIDTLVDAIFSKEERIDALINCAGIYPIVAWNEYTHALWEKVMATNVGAAFHLITKVAPIMIAQERPSETKSYIVNITSAATAVGSRDPGYSASKAALTGLTKSFAKSLAQHSICVNSIAPGPIHTPMSSHMKEEDKKKYTSQIPLGAFGEPEDVAHVADFLLSGKADYITGSTIHVNGGFHFNS